MKKQTAEASLVAFITDGKEHVYRLAYSYVKNQEDALDIVQESIHKALASVDSLRNPETMKSWFYKILVRTAIDFLRKQKKLKVMDDQTIEYLSKGKEDTYQDTDLYEALEELPHPYKTIIVLRFFEDLKLEEIAEITGENINTTKTRLYRGLKLMRIHLAKEDLS
ncbi:RNA polymerase sigma factor [Bacillus sonorensis]|uniref:RNA polymerase sigma factor SigV n=2 Tax=Bacillus sonorensis TaxID=119858 RepID=M5PCU0_9BACI|nr:MULTISPECIES: RNA polymerase sigma factor [Bacillus]TWK75963.1 RNA polymerase sigma factor SigV [Bacillus paralicheniformis]ASB90889.1 RNA polymerase sigma factor SigV [Bacillus sonorensis]EME74140.1 RNA polymerase sigma factor SigV [Bacillus sonorensis L12]MBG9913574.1 RNA polymerase sigma70 [Bacillus sonorensis]MCY7858453.1 RNA polymerase sigma factor [Bacillus sonorensis]